MADERLTLKVNLKHFAHTQYMNWDFSSMCRFQGRYVGAHPADGVCYLFEDSQDSGEQINAYFELATTDFGIKELKRFRKVQVGYETDGYLRFKFMADGTEATRTFYLQPTDYANNQVNAMMAVGRDIVGRYWRFRVENVEGSDFSLDNIHGIMIVLQSTRRQQALDLTVTYAELYLPALQMNATATVS